MASGSEGRAMRRRQFLGILSGAAASLPTMAYAQRTERPKIVGMVSAFSPSDITPLLEAFKVKLRELGWKEGVNVQFDIRLASGDLAALTTTAKELSQRRPDIVVIQGSPALTAARDQIRATPIVFLLVTDPVGLGFVKSLK